MSRTMCARSAAMPAVLVSSPGLTPETGPPGVTEVPLAGASSETGP